MIFLAPCSQARFVALKPTFRLFPCACDEASRWSSIHWVLATWTSSRIARARARIGTRLALVRAPRLRDRVLSWISRAVTRTFLTACVKFAGATQSPFSARTNSMAIADSATRRPGSPKTTAMTRLRSRVASLSGSRGGAAGCGGAAGLNRKLIDRTPTDTELAYSYPRGGRGTRKNDRSKIDVPR